MEHSCACLVVLAVVAGWLLVSGAAARDGYDVFPGNVARFFEGDARGRPVSL